MQRNLNSLLLRGLLGTALSLAAVAGAASQATRYQLDFDRARGTLVLREAPLEIAQCDAGRRLALLPD
jgi:hypothetical protein